MRFRREKQGLIENPQIKEESNTLTIILCIACVIVTLVFLIYVSMSSKFPKSISLIDSYETSIEPEEISIIETTVFVDNSEIYYREALPQSLIHYDKPEILLLHGAKYTSSTWKGLGTLQLFASEGFRTIAIDLPGFGLSKKANPPVGDEKTVAWMKKLFESLNLRKAVMVVPSAAGMFGIPVLVNSKGFDLSGFIAISPMYTNRFTKTQYEMVEIPLLLLWGGRDTTHYAEQSRYWLDFVPNSYQTVIPTAGHAVFVGNKELFHNETLSFIKEYCQIGVDINSFGEDETDINEDSQFNNNEYGMDIDNYDDEGNEDYDYDETQDNPTHNLNNEFDDDGDEYDEYDEYEDDIEIKN